MAHLDQIVKTGTVQSGNLIAYLGNSGTGSQGAHLHMERFVNGAATNLVLGGVTISPLTFPAARIYLSQGPLPSAVRYNPVAPGDAGFAKHGAASGWTSFTGGVYGTAICTTYVGNTVRDNWARWTFDLAGLSGAGGYKVEAYVTSTHAGTTKAHYHINTVSGVKYATVNQRVLSNAWANLGTYTLTSGAAWVELDDVTGEPYEHTENQQIVFDAIRLTYSNRAPTAVADSYTAAGGTVLTIAAKGVLANDSDVDGNALAASLAASVAHGSLSLGSNGGFTYTPAANYSGPDSFTYRAYDGAAYSSTVSVSINVTPGAPAPTPTPTPTPVVTQRRGELQAGRPEERGVEAGAPRGR